MTSIYVFPEEQLKELPLTEIRKLATYYEVKYTKHTPPKVLIADILEKQHAIIEKESETEEVELHPKSARVKRIEQSMRSKENE